MRAGDRGALFEGQDNGRRRGSSRPAPGRARPAGREVRAPPPGSVPFRCIVPDTPVRRDRARRGRDRSATIGRPRHPRSLIATSGRRRAARPSARPAAPRRPAASGGPADGAARGWRAEYAAARAASPPPAAPAAANPHRPSMRLSQMKTLIAVARLAVQAVAGATGECYLACDLRQTCAACAVGSRYFKVDARMTPQTPFAPDYSSRRRAVVRATVADWRLQQRHIHATATPAARRRPWPSLSRAAAHSRPPRAPGEIFNVHAHADRRAPPGGNPGRSRQGKPDRGI